MPRDLSLDPAATPQHEGSRHNLPQSKVSQQRFALAFAFS